MNKKLVKQIAAIVGVAAIFAFIDIGVYSTLVMRNISRHSPGMQKMSVETDKYVPFSEGSYIKSVDSDMKISENIPVIDGAAGLLPVYAGFVESIYPESAVSFNGSDYAPDSKMQYTKINKHHYWCADKRYNQIVDLREKPHSCSGEHLIDHTKQYAYAMNIGYNNSGEKGKGFAIFLHCFGYYKYTLGCVAVSKTNMIKILQTCGDGTMICIYRK